MVLRGWDEKIEVDTSSLANPCVMHQANRQAWLYPPRHACVRSVRLDDPTVSLADIDLIDDKLYLVSFQQTLNVVLVPPERRRALRPGPQLIHRDGPREHRRETVEHTIAIGW